MRTKGNFNRIFKNFFSLNLTQLSNIIIPLIILPYVVRVLGVEKFGLVSFAQSFIMYFVIFSDYGFNLSGTREISIYKSDTNKISEIFSSILILKLFIGFACLIILSILIINLELFRMNWILYLISSGILLGSVFSPYWFFQGIEKMEVIPIISISVRSLQVILTFLLIKEEADYLLYMFLISNTQFVIGITGLLVSIFSFKVKIIFPAWDSLSNQIKRGFNLFSANIGMNLISNSNTFILGILEGDYAVGIFSAADKIRSAVQGIIVSFVAAAYPNVVRLIKEQKSAFISLIKKTFKILLIMGFSSTLCLFVFAGDFINILFGNEFNESIILLRLLSITQLIVSVGIVYSILVLVASGYDKSFNKIILLCTAIHIIILLFLVSSLNTLGAVCAVIITEFLISLFSINTVYKQRLLKPIQFIARKF